MSSMFQSLRSYNYRLWAGGALVSNIGTWMQRIGQDWLVLTVLTHHNATAVGTVMALQASDRTGWCLPCSPTITRRRWVR